MSTNDPELEALNQMVLELHVRWQMFDELFSDPGQYPILNRTGACFWMTIQELLLDDLMISISRFLDPPRSCGQANLCLAAIVALPAVTNCRNDLQKRLDCIEEVWTKGIRNWRHKKLSHSDMQTVLKQSSLPNVPFSEIKQLVDMITEFSREIQHRVYQRDISYQCSIIGWVPQVMKYLELGVQKKDESLQATKRRIKDIPEN